MRHQLSLPIVVLLVGCANDVMTTRNPSLGAGGSAGMSAAGSAGASGASSGGKGGTGGLPGTAGGGAGGTGGSAGGGTGGTGGGTPEAELLSVDKTATTDSEEAGNTVDLGNDGQSGTRWCAADGGLDHWWSVDLGQSYELSHVIIHWEEGVAYQYLIEISGNGSAWSPLVDNTDSTSTTQVQTLQLEDAPEARHVRITVTGLPAGSWASFFEFSVYGY